MSFEETAAAHRKTDEIRDAMEMLLDCRFTEMWQVRDFVRLVTSEGYDGEEAARKVFCD
jgi:hypothetical protein